MRLEGSCRTPIAGLAVVSAGMLSFRGMLLSPDGKKSLKAETSGSLQRAAELGDNVAGELIALGAHRLLSGTA